MKTKQRRRVGSRPRNLGLVLRHAVREGRVSRTAIAQATGLTVGAVSRITHDLIAAGLLAEAGPAVLSGKRGRRFVELAPAPRGAYVIGLGITASGQDVAAIDLAGNVLSRRPLQVRRGADAAAFVARLAREVGRFIGEAKLDRERIFGIGVATIGVVDPVRGVLIESRTLGWREVGLAQQLEEALGLPVRVDSFLNALNLAEHRSGATRAKQNVMLVHSTIGIGASLIANGELIRGEGMQTGQIAHIRVPGAKLACVCGRQGCLATVASGRGVLQNLRIPLPKSADGVEDYARMHALLAGVIERSQEGHGPSGAAILQSGRALGRFIGGIVSFARPEAIVLGGVLAGQSAYIHGVREGLGESHLDEHLPPIVATRMTGDTAGALLALEELVCARPLRLERFRRPR